MKRTGKTSIRVKLRHPAEPGKAGTIYYQVTHKRSIRRISTHIRLFSEEWDPRLQKVADTCRGDSALKQHRIESDVAALHRIVRHLEERVAEYEVDDIVARFRSPQHRVTLLCYMQQQIESLIAYRRFGTARNYLRARNSLAAYCNREDILLHTLEASFVEGYNAFLQQRGIVRNSISFYMRILRAVYNKAVRQHLVEQTYPFKNVYTGIDRTRKRAVDEKNIAALFRLDLRKSPSLALARDMFVFSYCTRGMAFVDMAYLRKTNIRHSEIRYARHKTDQLLCVRIEPCVQEILDRYADASSIYIFPILKTEDSQKAFTQYQVALNYYNRQLKRLSEMLQLGCTLSSYTARHSWATAAHKRQVPLSVISAGMGHTSERTTQIYLTTLENSAIDAANRKIIASLKCS